MGALETLRQLAGLRLTVSFPERKMRFLNDPGWALRHPTGMLVHGPGSTDIILNARQGGYANSAVLACIQAYTDHYTEPPLRLWRGPVDDLEHAEVVEAHPVLQFLAEPNPYLLLSELDAWRRTMMLVEGNAYFVKVRAGAGNVWEDADAGIAANTRGAVRELWPVSPVLMCPARDKDSGNFLDYFALDVGRAVPLRVPPENVIHFRNGIDDRNHAVGIGLVKQLAREVTTDNYAEAFIAALIKNYGVPGLIISPSGDAIHDKIDRDTAEDIKDDVAKRTTGDLRGTPIILPRGVNVEQFGFTPDVMDLGAVWHHVESRIAGVLGVPAIVAGLEIGLNRSTFANFKEAREMFTEQRLKPAWRVDAGRYTRGLRKDFALRPDEWLGYDMTNVSALQEDQKAFREYVLAGFDSAALDLGLVYDMLDLGELDPALAALRKPDLEAQAGMGGLAFPAFKEGLAAALGAEVVGRMFAPLQVKAPHDPSDYRQVGPYLEDKQAERFQPVGQDAELLGASELAAAATLTEEDVNAAVAAWRRWVREDDVTLTDPETGDEVGLELLLTAVPVEEEKSIAALAVQYAWTAGGVVPIAAKAPPIANLTWGWDEAVQRYRYPSGRLVSPRDVNRVMERRLARSRVAMVRSSEKVAAGQISVKRFEQEMVAELREIHLQMRMLAVGGKAAMTAEHTGSVGGLLAKDFRFLDGFGKAISSGELSPGQIAVRASMYGQASVREDFRRGQLISHKAAGYGSERRVLNSANPCEGCSAEAAFGWVEIGSLAGIGAHECNGNDRCHMEYRREAPSEG